MNLFGVCTRKRKQSFLVQDIHIGMYDIPQTELQACTRIYKSLNWFFFTKTKQNKNNEKDSPAYQTFSVLTLIS